MTPSDSQNSHDPVTPAEDTACPSCGATTRSEARFCHACGAALAGGPSQGGLSPGMRVALGAAAVLIVVGVFVVGTYFEEESTPTTSVSPSAMPSGTSADLSQLTPRQSADHLFNQVMIANEQGNVADALRFAPLAIQAYEGLSAMDRDAHYHLALIHDVAGNRANVERELAAMRQGAPNHLLAFVVEHVSAEKTGDQEASSRALAAFAAAYDAEVALARPEYQAHSNTIERIRVLAAARAAPSGTAQ